MANRVNNNKGNMGISNAILVNDLLKILIMVELTVLQINEVIIIFDYY